MSAIPIVAAVSVCGIKVMLQGYDSKGRGVQMTRSQDPGTACSGMMISAPSATLDKRRGLRLGPDQSSVVWLGTIPSFPQLFSYQLSYQLPFPPS